MFVFKVFLRLLEKESGQKSIVALSCLCNVAPQQHSVDNQQWYEYTQNTQRKKQRHWIQLIWLR